MEKIFTQCDCGCVGVQFERIDFDDIEFQPKIRPEYCISFWVNSFYGEQNHFKKITKRFKDALNLLFKGTHRYEEIIWKEEDFDKFRRELDEMRKDSTKQ